MPTQEIEWRVFPAGELGLALEKGEVDAVADSEPIGSLLLAEGKVRNIADQAKDAPYKDEYCCAVIVNGKYLTANPEGRRRRDARAAEGRQVGGDEPARRGAPVGREEVSRLESGAEHHRDRQSPLHPERVRRRSGGRLRRGGNEDGRACSAPAPTWRSWRRRPSSTSTA